MATGTASFRSRAIVDAARECIAADGLTGATFERIAARAGVSRGLLHYHFRSKDELLLAVVRETCSRQTAALAGALAEPAAREAVVASLGAMLLGFLAEPTGFRLLSQLWAIASRDAAVRAEVGRLYAEQRAALASSIRTVAAERGTNLRAEPEAIAAAILAVADGVAVQAHAEPERPIGPTLEAALSAAEWLLGEVR